MEKTKEEIKPEYVALITTCGQVSPDDWEKFTLVMKLTNETTIGQIKAWAHKHHCGQCQIAIANLETP